MAEPKPDTSSTKLKTSGYDFAKTLLASAHPNDEAEVDRIFTTKVLHRPVPIHADARSLRQSRREKTYQGKSKSYSKKPKPLSAKQKRALQIYEIPKDARKYAIYEPLHALWVGYIHEILLNMGPNKDMAAKLCSADFHGSEIELVSSRCPSRVGIKGIVVKDTKHSFLVVTRGDEAKCLPKEYSVFRFEVPVVVKKGEDGEEEEGRPMVFELHGGNFMFKPAERSTKKFKARVMVDL